MSKDSGRPSTIVVSEEAEALHVLDTKNGGQRQVGQIVSRTFQGESVKRHFFETLNREGEWEVARSFRPTNEDVQFVDHVDVLKPLIDAGYQLKDQQLMKFGTVVVAHLEPESPVVVDDSILWDAAVWDWRLRQLLETGQTPTITESLYVNIDADPRRPITLDRGLYRLICTNGMRGKVLGYPGLRFSHKNFSPSTMINRLEALGHIRADSPEVLRGKFIGVGRGISRFAEFIDTTLLMGDDDVDGRNGDAPIIEVPSFIEEAVNPLERLPGWYMERFRDQLRVMSEALGPNGRVYALDLINAVTSPAAVEMRRQSQLPVDERKERSYNRIQQKQSSIFEASAKLIGALSLN